MRSTYRGRLLRQRLIVGAVACGIVFATAGIALGAGFWSSPAGAGNGQATSYSLNSPGVGMATGLTQTSLALSWDVSPGLPSGAGYRVLRSATGNAGSFSAVGAGACAGFLTSTSCSDSSLSGPGSTYYYEVEASAGSQWVSSPGPSFSGTTLSGDGTGILSTSTSTIAPSSTGNTIAFTFTPATGGTFNGIVTLTVPAGWTTPSSSGASGGYVTVSGGSGTNGLSYVGTGSMTIEASNVTLTSAQTLQIVYGSKTSGGPGATAPSTTNNGQVWQGQEASTSMGTLANISSPTIAVVNLTFVVTPSTTTPTAGTQFTVDIQAQKNGADDPTYTGAKCLTFSGPGNSPNNTVPLYPGPGTSSPCSAGQSQIVFNSGIASSVPATLFGAAQNVSLSLADGTRSGSVTVTVFSASQLGFSSCPATMTKNKNFGTTVTRPSSPDSYGNATTASAATVSLGTSDTNGTAYWTSDTKSNNGRGDTQITSTTIPAAAAATTTVYATAPNSTGSATFTASGWPYLTVSCGPVSH